MHRSGTNFLQDVLALHPDARPHPVNEDYVVSQLGYLKDFTDAVSGRWISMARDGGDLQRNAHRGDVVRSLASSLGRGVEESLVEGAPEKSVRLIMRTPGLQGLELFRLFFPAGRALVIIRDGRDVVASGQQGFGWSFESSAVRWATQVRALLGILNDASGQVAIVRYEQLAEFDLAELRSALAHVGLDANRFPYDDLRQIPVRGSSESAREDGTGLDWRQRRAVTEIQSVGRHRLWPSWKRARFDALAGRELQELGYERDAVSSKWAIGNQVADALKTSTRPVRRMTAKIRK